MNYMVNLRTIRALAKHIAPKDDIRPYLNGVALQFEQDGIYYVATDGRVLAAFRGWYDKSNEPPETPFSVLVPCQFGRALKPAKHRDFAYLDTNPYTIDGAPFTPLEGTFPAWRRVIPECAVESPTQQYTPDLLAALEACVRDALNTDKVFVYLRPNADRNGIVTCAEAVEFIGLVTPRTFKEPPPLPVWLRPAEDASDLV